jgi:hypothetical protein
MTIRRRLELAESALAARYPKGRCSHCCDWPAMQVKVKKAGEILEVHELERTCCPQCGWRPRILVINKVIVRTRDDVAALRGNATLL